MFLIVFAVTQNKSQNKDKYDGLWTTQFGSIFTMQNEFGQVLTWKLVEDQSFDCVRVELQALSHHLAAKVTQPKLIIIIDNCCAWRNKLQEVLGADIDVKLDLFQAVQRITKCLVKRHTHHAQCVNELSQVSVKKGDFSDASSRQEPTLQADAMKTNLNAWFLKWKSRKDTNNQNVLKDICQKQVKNLMVHIENGCLAEIPPSCGTNKNERMHQILNHCGLTVRRIGQELAKALLELNFFTWNKKTRHKTQVQYTN